ncbi:MAG TPA: hypothetical protein VK149_12360 [Sideroxyarcus sp.]|nr:hypothetical protein [Sideroxyarcus sp.]
MATNQNTTGLSYAGGTPGFYDKQATPQKLGILAGAPPTNNPSGVPLITDTPAIAQTAKSDTVAATAAKAAPSDLVESRVNNIIDANSPLMQLAAARANQRANDRGMLSSSVAVGEGQKAVMDAALPIASQDSQAINHNNQFNASNEQQVNLQNATQAQRTSELNAASENDAIKTNTENQMRSSLANLDVASRAFMAEVEQKNKQLIQTSANAATLFNTYQQQVSQIMTSPNLDAAGKEKAIQNLQTMLQDSLAAQDAVSGLNLSALIFGGTDSASQPTGNATTPNTPASQPSDPTNPQSNMDPATSGSSVICSQLYTDGHIDKEIYDAETKFASEMLNETTLRGYRFWAVPFVRLMRKSPAVYAVGKYTGKKWIEHSASGYTKKAKKNAVGVAILCVGVPVCFLIGLFVPDTDYKQLWAKA